jgi:hypothetical protein
MAGVSFKSLRTDGVISRSDLLSADWSDIHIDPGFNRRIPTPELQQSIQELAEYILAGGQVPPLELRVNEAGLLEVVDGHRRHAALGIAIRKKKDEGDEKEAKRLSKVYFLPFSGDKIQRISRIITSQDGRKLHALEIALVYLDLVKEGMSAEEIAHAQHPPKTRPHVEQHLLLATATPDVHSLVMSGAVTPTTAIDVIRKHGDTAGDFLRAKLQGSGKGKLTEGDVKGKALPRDVTDRLVGSVESFTAALPQQARRVLAEAEAGSAPANATVTISAQALLELVQTQLEVEAARQKQQERAAAKAAKAAQRDIEDAE